MKVRANIETRLPIEQLELEFRRERKKLPKITKGVRKLEIYRTFLSESFIFGKPSLLYFRQDQDMA